MTDCFHESFTQIWLTRFKSLESMRKLWRCFRRIWRKVFYFFPSSRLKISTWGINCVNRKQWNYSKSSEATNCEHEWNGESKDFRFDVIPLTSAHRLWAFSLWGALLTRKLSKHGNRKSSLQNESNQTLNAKENISSHLICLLMMSFVDCLSLLFWTPQHKHESTNIRYKNQTLTGNNLLQHENFTVIL